MKGFDKMANITKRGTSYRATVSIYKNSKNQRITKTFKTRKEAKQWTLEMELYKGKGKNIQRYFE